MAILDNPSIGLPDPVDLIRGPDFECSVTEWVNAPSLQLPFHGDIDRTVSQVAEVLLRSHRAGWVHGDIKPANLLMSKERGAVVIDWETANPIGALSVPGTLGYAPRRAWSEGYVATPANDVYALAVIAWELLHQRPLFVGDRSGVLSSQEGFRFPLNGDPTSIITMLFAAANNEASLDEFAEALFRTRTPALSADSLRREAARYAFRRSVPLSTATAEGIRSGSSVTLDVPPVMTPEEAVEAVACELRCTVSRNVVPVLDNARSCSAEPRNDVASSTRIDQIRDGRLLLWRDAATAARLLPDSVLVAPSHWPDDIAEDPPQNCEPYNTTNPPHGQPVVVRLRGGPSSSWSPALQRDLIRSLMTTCFGTSVIDEDVTELDSLHLPQPLVNLVARVLALVTRGALFTESAAVRVKRTPGGLNDISADDLEHSQNPRLNEIGQVDLDSTLAAGETAAALGEWPDTLRLCIAAHTGLADLDSPSIDLLIRLADLWVECGRGDAATAALERALATDTAPSPRVLLRLARVYTSRGEFDRLHTLLYRIGDESASRDDLVECGRLRAIAAFAAGDHVASIAFIKKALHERDGARHTTLLWLLNSAGNIFRLLGRSFTAKRLLTAARHLSTSAGSVRGRIATLGNLLLVAESTASPAQAAAESGRIAAACLRWGMDIDAAVHGMGAAVRWLRANNPSQAVALLDTVRDKIGRRASLPPSTRSMLDEVWFAAIDSSEDWERVAPVLSCGAQTNEGSDVWLHVQLLRTELGLADLPLAAALPRGSRSSLYRAISIADRTLRRPVVSGRRLGLSCLAVAESLDAASPIAVHVARLLVQSCPGAPALAKLLGVVRELPSSGSTFDLLSNALHLFALALTQFDEAACARTFLSSNNPSPAVRPLGARRWEWVIAKARASELCGQLDSASHAVEDCLDTLDAHVRRLPRSLRRQFQERVRLTGICRLAGVSPSSTDKGLGAKPGPEWRINSLRAEIHRERGGLDASSSRASGLERVLRSALALRSTMDVEQLLDSIVSSVLAVCRAERAVVIYELEPGAVRSKLCVGSTIVEIGLPEAEVSSGILEEVRQSGRACLFDDACGAEGLGDRPSVLMYKPRSLIVAPIRVEGSFRGYLYVENRSVARSFGVSQLELVEGFAAQASLALENAQLVTRLRASCRDLEAARVDAVRSESLRVLGRMASEVAHDFNNLLTTIIGETQLLLQDGSATAHRESLASIERAALDGAAVIRRIQDSTRIRTDRDFEIVEVSRLVSDVALSLKQRIAGAGCRVIVDAPEQMLVRGVATELREALTNMVVNSLDAMPHSGMLRLSCGCEVGHALVEVEDSGCGMSADTVSRMFDPFFSTKGSKGNGLGLSIAYGIVRRHGGDISVTSALGHGTRMRVRIPVLPRDLIVGATAQNPECQDEAPRIEGIRHVLVVDDEPGVGSVLSQMLGRLGVSCEVLSSAKDAIRLISSHSDRFDVVITDFHMPEATGLEVARAAASQPVAARVILMSGSLNRGGVDIGQFPVTRVLQKPFTLGEVCRVLRGL